MGKREGPFEANGVEPHAHPRRELSRGHEHVASATPQIEQSERFERFERLQGLIARFRLAQERTQFGEHRACAAKPPIGCGYILKCTERERGVGRRVVQQLDPPPRRGGKREERRHIASRAYAPR